MTEVGILLTFTQRAMIHTIRPAALPMLVFAWLSLYLL
jgi:hypothetical protein